MSFGLSVIIPMHNGEPFIQQTLDSIARQDWPDLEVIVVNDGSRDDGPQIAARSDLPVTVVHQDQHGPAVARNHGLELASKPYVTFVDADDVWPCGRLRTLASHLDGQVDAVVGCLRRFHEHSLSTELAIPQSCLSLGTSLFLASIFTRFGHFDPSLRFSEDVDWFLRARDAGCRLRFIQDVVLMHRRHDTNMTNDLSIRDSNIFSILAASIRRRRSVASATNPTSVE